MRRMAAPIGELASTAEAMAAGESTALPQRSRYRELDRLSLAISTLASDLDKRGSDVEQASGTLEVVLGAIPQGTILFEGDDRIIYSNTAARQILGVLPEALGGFTPLQLQMAVREARKSGSQVIKVVEHGKPVRILRGTATPFSEDDRVLLVIVDITERERTDSVRRDFVANASHELKTPVATIIASAEALQISLSRGDSSAEKFAATIERSARQLDRLVTDLLDLSRLEKETPDLVPVRLDLLVMDEVERVGERAASQGIRLDPECEHTTVMGSRRDLAIAVRNLLDNAIRHTPTGGSVDVSLARDGDSAVLRVTDTGEGIPTRDLQRVFERFYRVDSARSRGTGGTGLGLSIVRHVVESHGGSVWAESELARGSVFTVSLPIVVDGAASADN
jgi:two-component system phosphate regulon sensor histidine kinase PhoR